MSLAVPQMLNTSEGCIYVTGVHPQIGAGDGGHSLSPGPLLDRWSFFLLSLSVVHAAPLCWEHSQLFWKQLVFSHRICKDRCFFLWGMPLLFSKQTSHCSRGQMKLLASTLELLLTVTGVPDLSSAGHDVRLARYGGKEMWGKGRNWLTGPHYTLLIWVPYHPLLLTGLLLLHLPVQSSACPAQQDCTRLVGLWEGIFSDWHYVWGKGSERFGDLSKVTQPSPASVPYLSHLHR